MLQSYSTSFDSNLERECQACMQRTRTVEKNRIARYPEILCIVLCHSITNGGRILSSVNFPVENFQPSEYLNDENDDTIYDLIASVNHQAQPNGGGHYFAICRQNILGRWYKYGWKCGGSNVNQGQRHSYSAKKTPKSCNHLILYKKKLINFFGEHFER